MEPDPTPNPTRNPIPIISKIIRIHPSTLLENQILLRIQLLKKSWIRIRNPAHTQAPIFQFMIFPLRKSLYQSIFTVNLCPTMGNYCNNFLFFSFFCLDQRLIIYTCFYFCSSFLKTTSG